MHEPYLPTLNDGPRPSITRSREGVLHAHVGDGADPSKTRLLTWRTPSHEPLMLVPARLVGASKVIDNDRIESSSLT